MPRLDSGMACFRSQVTGKNGGTCPAVPRITVARLGVQLTSGALEMPAEPKALRYRSISEAGPRAFA
jgi:hypothetical protein